MPLLSALLLVSACGGSKAKEPTTGPGYQQDVAKTEAGVKGCIKSQGNLAPLLHSISARTNFIDCFAPATKAAKIEGCAARAITSDAAVGNTRLARDLALCVERAR